MRILSALFLLIFTTSCYAQDVLSEFSNAEKVDSNYYLTTTVITDNGTAYPDTLTKKAYLGDSLTAASKLLSEVQEYNIYLHRICNKLFEVMGNSELVKLNQAYMDITGQNIYVGLSEKLAYRFEGRYRIFDGNTNYFANAELNVNGVLRLVSESDPSVNYLMRPTSENSFIITNHPNGLVNMYEYKGIFNDQRKLYLSEKRAARDNSLRIVFVKAKEREGF